MLAFILVFTKRDGGHVDAPKLSSFLTQPFLPKLYDGT